MTTPNNTSSSVLDPVVRVHSHLDGHAVQEWRLTHNLSDRQGLRVKYSPNGGALALLNADLALVQRLAHQMWEDFTFVARKDGQFGVLFEVEFSARESEPEHYQSSPEQLQALKPRAEVEKQLLQGLDSLASLYPGVAFAVPVAEQPDSKPAAWAFVPEGLLDDHQRRALGEYLLGLA